MKRAVIVLCLLGLLLAIALFFFTNPTVRLQMSLVEYSKLTKGDLPEDLRLTIYYLDAGVLTRAPWDVDMLISGCSDKIIVESDELAPYWQTMQEMDLSALKPAKEEYMNARLYYVLETDKSHRFLEVVYYNGEEGVFVNGIAVEKDPRLAEIIAPFLETSIWAGEP